METALTPADPVACPLCGKTYTGDKAANQLRGHMMKCPRKKTEKTMTEKTQKQQPENETQKPKPLSLTPEERLIAELAESQDTSWHTITEGDMEDFSLSGDPMELPPPAKKAQQERKYAFFWAQATHARIHQLTRVAVPPFRWSLCTRTTYPELAKYVNDQLGCVSREDCVLMFKPWAHHAIVVERKHKASMIEAESRGIEGGKHKIDDRGDVEAYSGKKFKISGRDEVIGEAEDFEDMGDLVDVSGE